MAIVLGFCVWDTVVHVVAALIGRGGFGWVSVRSSAYRVIRRLKDAIIGALTSMAARMQ